MSEKSMFVNNFSVSTQNLVCILEAKSLAPNIETLENGKTMLFGNGRIVDEDYLYMPIEVGKELVLALLQVISTQEKNTGITVNLPEGKQELWEALKDVAGEHPLN